MHLFIEVIFHSYNVHHFRSSGQVIIMKTSTQLFQDPITININKKTFLHDFLLIMKLLLHNYYKIYMHWWLQPIHTIVYANHYKWIHACWTNTICTIVLQTKYIILVMRLYICVLWLTIIFHDSQSTFIHCLTLYIVQRLFSYIVCMNE